MNITTMTTSNGNSHCKSYKTVANAKKEIARIEEQLDDLEGRLSYVIAVNDDGRFYLQFAINNSTSELSFHWIINQGHCVMVF